ncbi:MAG: hypothetical protein ACI9LM_000494 [Alteromonadaceae bacterium]|jgi:hypothetical protein
MAFNVSKALMVLLICVAFAGQTMASTIMSYHMMSMTGMSSQEQSQDMTMMDHSNHNMVSELDDSEKSTKDCCSQTCNCFTGGCSSVATFMKGIVGNGPVVDLSSKILSYSSLALSQQPTSLYRPPILS